jgi:Ankyrin repeats (3 copies)
MMRQIALLAFASAFSAFAWDANEDLLSASRLGNLAAVTAAVEKGAALETKTAYGQTPLYLAAMNGHEEVVRFLLDKGASTDVKDTFYKAPMLVFVIQRKHWDVAKLLVSKTSNPDQTLSDVAGAGRAELVQAVLDNGKPSQASLDKAYENAFEQKKTEVADLLKKAGAHEPAPPVSVEPAVLESYAGTYKTEQIPLDIKVFVKEGRLYLQATGQPEFAPKPLSATRFAFAPARLEVEFDSADSFTLKQGGGVFQFKKAVSK